MKKVGQLMQELGFRKDAPESVQKAFLNHLIKAANQEPIRLLDEKAKRADIETTIEQLSFDFMKVENGKTG